MRTIKKAAPALALILGTTLVPTATTGSADAAAANPKGTAYDTIGVTSFNAFQNLTAAQAKADAHKLIRDRKRVVSGKGVSVRVDHGGARFIKKKKKNN